MFLLFGTRTRDAGSIAELSLLNFSTARSFRDLISDRRLSAARVSAPTNKRPTGCAHSTGSYAEADMDHPTWMLHDLMDSGVFQQLMPTHAT